MCSQYHKKKSFLIQNSLTAVEHVMLEASAAEEQNLMYEQSDLRIEVVELTRLAAIKVFCMLLWLIQLQLSPTLIYCFAIYALFNFIFTILFLVDY